MSDQLAIDFEPPRARRSDPDTAHGAAVIAINRATTHREMALRALYDAGERGKTDFELADTTGVPQTSIGCRRGDLVRAGLVNDKRPSPSGAPALVWVHIDWQRADAKEGA